MHFIEIIDLWASKIKEAFKTARKMWFFCSTMKNEYGISALPKSSIKDSAHFHNLNPPDKLNLKKKWNEKWKSDFVSKRIKIYNTSTLKYEGRNFSQPINFS